MLKRWDNLADSVGLNRTSMIHSAVRVYELFVNNQLNGDKKGYILEQINQLDSLIINLKNMKDLQAKEKEEIDNIYEEKFNSGDINLANIKDFNLISNKILDLLENWGSLRYETISVHLQYPKWIIWTVLKKLKKVKKVKVINGEWRLYGKL